MKHTDMENIGKLEAQDILDGQLMLIDKPLTWTSFDAVKKLRYLLRTKFGFKKLKVGHAEIKPGGRKNFDAPWFVQRITGCR